jgi:hypothetical protein
MAPIPSARVTLAVVDAVPDVLSSPVTCPLCHTPAPLTQTEIDIGGGWRCVRCLQSWDGERLTAVAAYATWAEARQSAAVNARADSAVPGPSR